MSRTKLFIVTVVLISITAGLAFADGPHVQEIPLPKEATDVTYMRSRGDIRGKVASDFKTVGNFYATTLKEQQWTKLGKDNLQKNFWVQSFAKNRGTSDRTANQSGEA